MTNSTLRGGLIGTIMDYASTLRFPRLVAVTAAIFLIDLIIPDFIPFADEILLGLLTLILASFKKRKEERKEDAGGPVIDIRPEPPRKGQGQ